MERLSDVHLYEKLRENDQSALEALYDRYERLLYSFAYRMTGNEKSAEDVIQDVFLKLWKPHAPYSPDKGKFSSWLLTMVRNTAMDLHRKKSRQAEVSLVDRDTDVTAQMEEIPEQYVEWKEKQSTIRLAMSTLNKDQQAIVDLFYFQGLSQDAIASSLNIPLGTVKSRIRLALSHLRKNLHTERGVLQDGTTNL